MHIYINVLKRKRHNKTAEMVPVYEQWTNCNFSFLLVLKIIGVKCAWRIGGFLHKNWKVGVQVHRQCDANLNLNKKCILAVLWYWRATIPCITFVHISERAKWPMFNVLCICTFIKLSKPRCDNARNLWIICIAPHQLN